MGTKASNVRHGSMTLASIGPSSPPLSMTAPGQTRRFREVLGMPAYPPTPDMLPRRRERSKRANKRHACKGTDATVLRLAEGNAGGSMRATRGTQMVVRLCSQADRRSEPLRRGPGHAVRVDKCAQPWDVQTIGDGVVQARTACVSPCTFCWCKSAASTPVVLVKRSSVLSSSSTGVSARSV